MMYSPVLPPSSSSPAGITGIKPSLLHFTFNQSQRRFVLLAFIAVVLFTYIATLADVDVDPPSSVASVSVPLPALTKLLTATDAPSVTQAMQQVRDPRLIPGTNLTATIVFPHDTTHIDWVDEHLSDLPVVVYSYNDQEAEHYAPGHCNEADTYLQYIIDYYHDLPDINIFLHSHVSAWHVAEPGLIETLKTLRWQRLYERGLTSFTCWAYYTELQRGVFKGVIYGQWEAFEHLWGPMFSGEFGEHPPERMSAYQASSFAVTRQAIKSRPLSFYRRAKKWCTDASNEDAQMTG